MRENGGERTMEDGGRGGMVSAGLVLGKRGGLHVGGGEWDDCADEWIGGGEWIGGSVWSEEMIEGMSGVEGTVSNGTCKTFHIIPSTISPFPFYHIHSPIPSATPTKQNHQPHSYYSIHSPYSQHIPHTPNTSSFPRHPHLPHPPSAAGNADYTN